MSTASRPRKLLTMADAVERTTLSRSTLNRMIGNGEFPSMIDLTDSRSAFIEAEVDAWIQARIVAARGEAAIVDDDAGDEQ